jgi:acyl-coenzyme A thioesterase PaaI-like protein
MDLQKLLRQAEHSGFYKWLLNRGLSFTIPFNSPHRFEVLSISDEKLTVKLPYRRSNFNHIRGIHACALATVSEFSTGLLLIKRLDPSKYRLIMQRLEMDYHYQGKMDATATFSVSEEWLAAQIFEPLETADSVVVVCNVLIHDVAGNHLTTGKVHWQIKDWKKVRTKVS